MILYVAIFINFIFNNMLVLCACMVSHFSHVQLCETQWTVACQAPLSIEFSRQEYWNELSFPSPGDLPDPGIFRVCYIDNHEPQNTFLFSSMLIFPLIRLARIYMVIWNRINESEHFCLVRNFKQNISNETWRTICVINSSRYALLH